MYEEYEFGIKADRMQISDPLKLVQLKIIYELHDKSAKDLTLSIYNGSAWKQIKDPIWKNIVALKIARKGNSTYDIRPYVNTTDET